LRFLKKARPPFDSTLLKRLSGHMAADVHIESAAMVEQFSDLAVRCLVLQPGFFGKFNEVKSF
jgi:hypothetical protein